MKRFSVLDSDGENNYLYDYQTNDTGEHYCTVYIDGAFWYEKSVTDYEFNTMSDRAVDLNARYTNENNI